MPEITRYLPPDILVSLETCPSTHDVSDGHFLEPLTISLPSTSAEIGVPAECIQANRESYWYIDLGQDSVFDYRSVEVPREVAMLCPNRNLSAFECSSIGITQSKGWENYWRQSTELCVFMFRRPRADVSVAEVRELQLKQIEQGIEMAQAAIANCGNSISRDFLVFPTILLCMPNRYLQPRSVDMEFTSSKQVIEFQLELLCHAKSIL